MDQFTGLGIAETPEKVRDQKSKKRFIIKSASFTKFDSKVYFLQNVELTLMNRYSDAFHEQLHSFLIILFYFVDFFISKLILPLLF